MQLSESDANEIYKMLHPKVPYQKFKYNNNTYQIGDDLLIKLDYNSNEISHSIAKLVRIIPQNGIPNNPTWPSIEVEWYYEKSEMIRNDVNALTNDNYYNSIGNDEIFSSKHRDIIYIEAVVKKVRILSLEDYEKESPQDIVYFCRARYDPFNFEIIPDIRKWTKYCYCLTPYNPDRRYLQCMKCQKLFHLTCIGISQDEIEKKKFYCKQCE